MLPPRDNPTSKITALLRLLFFWLLVTLSGCSILQKPAEPPPPEQVVEETLVVTPTVPTPPPIVKEVIKQPVVEPLDVAIIISRDIGNYHELAAEIGITISATGGNFRPYYLYQQQPAALINTIKEQQHRQVVAIGLKAAKATDSLSDIPVIFCQIYNYQDHQLINEQRKGVTLVPSINKQLSAWKEILPSLTSVGVIIGKGKEHHIDQAEAVASQNGFTLVARTAKSDKELWLEYRRLVQQVDAFWLLPDNRILSKRVLRDMVNYSLKHDTPLLTINGLLLKAGALISAAQINSNVATTVVDRLNAANRHDGIPGEEVSPLDNARIILNTQVQKRYNIMISKEINVSNFERWPSPQVTATISR